MNKCVKCGHAVQLRVYRTCEGRGSHGQQHAHYLIQHVAREGAPACDGTASYSCKMIDPDSIRPPERRQWWRMLEQWDDMNPAYMMDPAVRHAAQ